MSTAALEHLRTGEGTSTLLNDFMLTKCLYAKKHVQ